MFTAVAGLLLVVAIFVMALFVARRLLRLAIKLALAAAVIFALISGALFGWWRGWFDAKSESPQPVRKMNQRANTNSRRR